MLLKDKLRTKDFIITTELIPPKGSDLSIIIDKAQKLSPKIDAINIPDSPMGRMKISSIITAYLIEKETEIETIPHLSCRDRNRIALQGDLLGAASLGIKNILAITGDNPNAGDHPQAKGVFDANSISLVKTIKKLNSGLDINDNRLKGSTDLIVATAHRLETNNLDKEIERLKIKVEAGADFIQTQPCYDLSLLNRFLAKTVSIKVPILIGILPLTSYKLANYLAKKVPGIEIPSSILSRMKGKGEKEGIKITREFLEVAYDKVDGIHLMAANNSDIVLEVLKGGTI